MWSNGTVNEIEINILLIKNIKLMSIIELPQRKTALALPAQTLRDKTSVSCAIPIKGRPF